MTRRTHEKIVSRQNPGYAISEEDNSVKNWPVVLFSGQGSQSQGMGREIAENDSDAMALWEEAERASGLPLRAIYWEGSDAERSDTRALQPALTAHHYNLWRNLKNRTGLHPFAAAGHSLGEFSAMAASGIISPENTIWLTALRGKLMGEADPERKGAMAALVKLKQEEIETIIEEAARESGSQLIAANYNTPSQIVISGAREAVELACKKARERMGRGIPLAVSGAFHSPFMKEANEEFVKALEKAEWKDGNFPVYCNVDASPVQRGVEAKEKLALQMISPVRWSELVNNIYDAGGRLWLEISPRPVLGKMVSQNVEHEHGKEADIQADVVDSSEKIRKYEK